MNRFNSDKDRSDGMEGYEAFRFSPDENSSYGFDDYGSYSGREYETPPRENSKSVLEYPWYLSIWLIFCLSAMSFLVIPGIIAIILTVKRENYNEKLFSYFDELDQKKKEIETRYRELDMVVRHAHEQADAVRREAEINSARLMEESQRRSRNILQSAESEKNLILTDMKMKEDSIGRKEEALSKREKDLQENIDKTVRKLNLFCNNINEFKEKSVAKDFLNKFYDGYEGIIEPSEREKNIKTFDIYKDDNKKTESGFVKETADIEADDENTSDLNDAEVSDFDDGMSDSEITSRINIADSEEYKKAVSGKPDEDEYDISEPEEKYESQDYDEFDEYNIFSSKDDSGDSSEKSETEKSLSSEGKSADQPDVQNEGQSNNEDDYDDDDDMDEMESTLRIKIPDEYLD